METAKAADDHTTTKGIPTAETPAVSGTGKAPPADAVPLPSAPSAEQPDFEGDVETNNELPSQATLSAIENYTVLDRDGKTHPFKSLYSGHNVARRVLVIFVRHFFCGNCQEYLRVLSASITPDALLALPVSTFIAVVGCGSPKLIDMYVKETGCPFPVYADPTCRLYQELGMVRTLDLGPRPAYMRNSSLARTTLSGIVQGLKQVHTGLVLKMGDTRQVGGEFLFEPASRTLRSPIASPVSEKRFDAPPADAVEEKCVTWCHRMRNTRDHAEIPEVMEVLGLGAGEVSSGGDGNGALRARKGTGVTMAAEMARLSVDVTKDGKS
ncbi:hypothetical protein F4861DRAFT_531624 [Xylaria intraflava]|nr:hypothetical protein F4861DRAFT_531624 [Xylaria intraflava]